LAQNRGAEPEPRAQPNRKLSLTARQSIALEFGHLKQVSHYIY
jgi:hypothetical protein